MKFIFIFLMSFAYGEKKTVFPLLSKAPASQNVSTKSGNLKETSSDFLEEDPLQQTVSAKSGNLEETSSKEEAPTLQTSKNIQKPDKTLGQTENSAAKKPMTDNKSAVGSSSTATKKPVAKKKSYLSKKGSSHRLVSSLSAFLCSDHFESRYKRGYILFSSACAGDNAVCLAYSEVKRNECDKDNLVRYFCNSSAEMGFSAQVIPCEKGCDSGKCL